MLCPDALIAFFFALVDFEQAATGVHLVFVKVRKGCGRISCIKHVELDERLRRAVHISFESGPLDGHCHHVIRVDPHRSFSVCFSLSWSLIVEFSK